VFAHQVHMKYKGRLRTNWNIGIYERSWIQAHHHLYPTLFTYFK